MGRTGRCAIDQWFPEPSGGKERPESVVPLLEMCAGCPVRRECLLDATDSDEGREAWGVFGGSGAAADSSFHEMTGERNQEDSYSASRRLATSIRDRTCSWSATAQQSHGSKWRAVIPAASAPRTS